MLRWIIVSIYVLSVVSVRVAALHTGAFGSAGYRRLARVDGDHMVPLAITLKPRDFRSLEDRLWSVSDPRDAEYGNHLSKDEANTLAQPDHRALAALYEWIGPFVDAESKQTRISETTNTLKVSLHARQLEALLSTQLHEYESLSSEPSSQRRRLVRASSPLAIPEHLTDAIAYVSINAHPLNLRSLAASASSNAEASDGGTLEKIRRLYDIPHDLVVTNVANSQAVPSFYHESWSKDDLKKFYKQFLPNDPMPHMVAKGDRANIESKGSIEASLDVQYISGIARNTTTYVWTMNGSNPYSVLDEPFVAFAESVLEMDAPPLVVSISYSDDEEHIFHMSGDYARSFDTLLIKMGLRGITVLIASGDDGVAGLRPEFEKIPPAQACNKHGPQWPSASPYITSVGATMTMGPKEPDQAFFSTDDEVVCSGEIGGMITSGGGFSNEYAMPEYQRRAVGRYLSSKRIPTRAGFFNASGRAYPDLSALGASFLVYLHGHTTTVSGTSASTPVVGGMVTLWNDIRLNAGKPPLGFINPLLYHLAEHEPMAFHDIVVGNNGASKGNARTCADSFGAAAGWDATSGVGTPNFAVIAEFIRGLDDKFNASTLANSTVASCAPTTTTAASSQSSSGARGNTLQIVLILTPILIAVAIGVFVAVGAIKQRRRTQYASLNGPNGGVTREERSSSTPPGSPTSSPRGSVVRLEEDRMESSGIEMSEISLHE